MEFWRRFEPRNPALAKTLLFVLTWVAVTVAVVFTLAEPSHMSGGGSVTSTGSIVTLAGCAFLASVVTWLWAAQHAPSWLWATYPFAGIALIALMDVISHDATVTAQVYFFFPVLYGGAQLRRVAAASICLAAVLADALVNLTLGPGGTAVMDMCFVATALAATAVVLVHAGERTDALIARLEHQAAIDPLTGLLTRRVLDSAVLSALEGAGSDGGTALLLLDIDFFKTVNDTHGHPAGDAVLQQLAALLTRVHRRGDLISRMGGDEIAILLPGCTLWGALQRAEEILLEVRAHIFDVQAQTLANPDNVDASSVPISVSIGVAHLPTHAQDLRALYATADAALYIAKTHGRDCAATTEADVKSLA